MKKSVLVLIISGLFLFGCKKDKKTPGPTTTTPEETVTEFTIPETAVTLNPSGYAPLSALLKFTSPISGHTEIVIEGKHGAASDVSQSFNDEGINHTIPVIGLYAGYNNTLKISVVDEAGNRANSTITIQTGTLPPNMPNYINVDVIDTAQMEPGMNLVSSFAGVANGARPMVPYIMDRYGDIRWCLDYREHPDLKSLSYDCGISRLKNGNFMFGDQSTNKIYEVDILGKVVNVIGLSGMIFHHEVVEKPNGNLLLSVTHPLATHPSGTPTIEDHIIEIDRVSGQIITLWDLRQSLDQFRSLVPDVSDWIHVNAIVHDPTDNTIIISGRTQGVFKLTYDNKLKWILSPHQGFNKNGRGESMIPFLLKPLDAAGNIIADPNVALGTATHPDFDWTWYQHSVIITPNHTLMFFDNGSERNFDETRAQYSRAVEFKIDEQNMTIQQVWEYGKERGLETFSNIVSSVKFLPTKHNILFSPGRAVQNAVGKGGKMVEINYDTKQVVWEASVSSDNEWGFHRVERMPLYPNGNSYTE